MKRDVVFVTAQVFTCNTSAHAHAGAVMCVKEVRGFVVSASTDSTLRVWRKEDLSHVKTLRGHRGAVLTLACVGELLLSGGRDNAIRVWDLDGGACCRRTLVSSRGRARGALDALPSKFLPLCVFQSTASIMLPLSVSTSSQLVPAATVPLPPSSLRQLLWHRQRQTGVLSPCHAARARERHPPPFERL